MSVNLEQIEMLKARANIGYGEAREILEKCNNDVVEALINLETQSKLKNTKTESNCESGFWAATKKLLKAGEKLFKKGNEIKFVINKAESTVIDLPVNLIILVTILMPPLTVIGILVALVTNHRIKFVKPGGEGMEINKTFDKISAAVTSVSSQVAEAINKD